MNRDSSARVVLLALLAASAFLFAYVVTQGFAPFWRTELGQRALNKYLQVKADVPRGTAMARVGETLPMITLPDLHGRRTTLPDDFAGRPLVLTVWATWCPPCRREMPWLNALAKRQDGPQVVGLAWDEEHDVRAFAAVAPVEFTTLLSPAEPPTLVRLGNPSGVLPFTLLIDAQGKVLKQRIGPFESAQHLAEWVRTQPD